MSENYSDYMKSQAESRLIQIIRDAENYSPGVADAAKIELLSRGLTEADIETLEVLDEDAAVESSDALDSVWLKYKKSKTASGLLLLLVLLLVLQILRTVFNYGFIHFNSDEKFGFITSLCFIFLPLITATFSAYSIWKLQRIGWIMAHGYAWLVIGSRVYQFVLLNLSDARNASGGWLEQIPLALKLETAADMIILGFVLVLLNGPKNIERFKVDKSMKRLAYLLLPLAVLILFYSLHSIGLSL